jgi:hypothetical protein
MASFRDNPGHDAPEVSHEQHDYLYSVPDETPAYALPPSKGYGHAAPAELQYGHLGARKGWKRWWILALLGILIALLAGLVGGFVGQAIQKGRQPTDFSASSTLSSDAGNSTSCAPTSSSNSTANLTNVTIGTIVQPDTGCNFPASKARNRLSKVTVSSNQIKYTVVCNSGWINSGLIALYTLTPADCIEACYRYNDYARNRPKGERVCVGGGFIPRWVDQSKAKVESIGSPFNCFLQYDADGIVENDRSDSDVEVVALCLDGKCNNAGT